MEGEIQQFITVWLLICISLSYCYILGKITKKGIKRLIWVLPVVVLFLVLPLKLHSVHLGGITAFFIAWLANFKLLLFAFGKGPLCSSDPSLSLGLFLVFACLPIKIQQNKDSPSSKSHLESHNNEKPSPKSCHHDQNDDNPSPKSHLNNGLNQQIPPSNSHLDCLNQQNPSPKSHLNGQINENPSSNLHLNDQNKQYPYPAPHSNGQNKQHLVPKTSKKGSKSPINYTIKVLLFALLLKAYDYKYLIHPNIIMFLYCFHIYFVIETILTTVATLARVLLNLELEPQFNEPYLSTSLQDFWGRRWNLMVTSILRPTVYQPVLNLSNHLIRRRWAPVPAIFATFLVSALMHELIFFYLGRVRPTWEITGFFLLHGCCLVVEIVVKKMVNRKFRLPRLISGPLTVVFVFTTVYWLFLPQLLRCKADVRALEEYAAVGAWVKNIGGTLRDTFA